MQLQSLVLARDIAQSPTGLHALGLIHGIAISPSYLSPAGDAPFQWAAVATISGCAPHTPITLRLSLGRGGTGSVLWSHDHRATPVQSLLVHVQRETRLRVPTPGRYTLRVHSVRDGAPPLLLGQQSFDVQHTT